MMTSPKLIPDINPEIWNKADTIERLGGDEELLRELVGIFVTESPKLLEKLRQGIASSDPQIVKREAHSLKGELGCLGAMVAAKTAQKLETMGTENKLDEASRTFLEFERQFQTFKVMLTDSLLPNK